MVLSGAGATTGLPSVQDVLTPAAVVDLDVLEANIDSMAARAGAASIALRPHVKTHRSVWIGQRQLAAGAQGISVARLGEAEVFAAAGFDDILIAFPVVGRANLRRLSAIRERVVVAIAVDDVGVAAELGRVVGRQGRPIDIYVEVDTGLGRCGLPPGAATAELALKIASLPGVTVKGLITHAGHSYRARNLAHLRAIALREAGDLVETAEALRLKGLDVPELSIGSTPTAHFLVEVGTKYPQITEARPGTYVFNDADQLNLGIVDETDCALSVLATVISRPRATRMVADAGSKVLGSDASRLPGFGRIRGHPDLRVAFLNEEHAVIDRPVNHDFHIGDRIDVIPNHSCLVPNLVGTLYGIRRGRVERQIMVDARGRSQ